MLIGQSLLTGTSDPTFTYYSAWGSRGANAGVFVMEVLFASGSFDLDIAIEHKNTEDADSAAATAATFTTITSTGTFTQSASGLKELVRYKYEL